MSYITNPILMPESKYEQLVEKLFSSCATEHNGPLKKLDSIKNMMEVFKLHTARAPHNSGAKKMGPGEQLTYY